MSKPIPIRFEAEVVELLQFAGSPLGGYPNQADFIREAVEEKLRREGVREKYEAASRAVEEIEEKEELAREVLTELVAV